jgi:hypothetical protein
VWVPYNSAKSIRVAPQEEIIYSALAHKVF